MKQEISVLRRMVGSLLALTMLVAAPLFTACSDNEEPDPTPAKQVPAKAGAITLTELDNESVELTVAAVTGAETYRWYKDGKKVKDTTTPSYVATESAKYKVAGMNSEGEGETSDEVLVTLMKDLLPEGTEHIEFNLLDDGSLEVSVSELARAKTYRFYREGEVVQESESRVYIDEDPTTEYGVSGVNEYGEGPVCFVLIDPVGYPEAVVEATKLAFNDIQISARIFYADKFYAGNVMTEAFVAEDVLASLEMMTPSTKTSYEGPLTGFPEDSGEMILPGVSYTVWVVFPKSGAYTAEDILTFEFTAPQLSEGGSINVTAGEPYLTQNEVEVDLTAEGAYAINFVWLTPEQMEACTDAASKVELLLGATQFEGGFATAYSGTSVALEPESDVWLLALAIDQEGRYGQVLEQKYTTLPAPKNFTLTIDQEALAIHETGATISWTLTDGEAAKVVYYYAPADDPFWLNNLGESVETAAEYMIINPTHKNFKTTTQSYVELTGLTEGVRYTFVAVAFDADENPSKGDGLYFTPQSSVIFVARYLEDGTENPEWTATRPTINVQDFCFLKGQFTRLFWMVDVVDGTTGYTTATSASYVDEYYSTQKAWAMDIKTNPDNNYSVYYWVPDDPNIPDPNHEQGGGTSVSAKTTEVYEDKIYYHPRAHGDTMIYVTWTDADGRLYEPYSIPMPVLEAE